MLSKTVQNICAFVPSKDFELSTQFYKDIGFECPCDDDDVRYLKLGDYGFLLQDYYVEDWAKNFMMNLHVEDVDRWYRHLKDLNIEDKYPGVSISKPKRQDRGLIEMHVVDPTGVLWHITQMA